MKHAYEISELVALGPLGRSKIYEKIADGSLRARKLDKKTIILEEDWRAFLTALPEAKLTGDGSVTKRRAGPDVAA